MVTEGAIVKQMQAVFEADWALTDSGRRAAKAANGSGDAEPGRESDTAIAS